MNSVIGFFADISDYVYLIIFISAFLIKRIIDGIFNVNRVLKRQSIKNKKSGILFFMCALYGVFFSFVKKSDESFVVGSFCLFFVCDYVFQILQKNIEKKIIKKIQEKSENKPPVFSHLPSFTEKALSSIKVVPMKESVEYQNSLNFSHVKNVIKRLNCYSLTPAEKKQVEDLSFLLVQAENGKTDLEISDGINEGLNSLLKILSKYAV